MHRGYLLGRSAVINYHLDNRFGVRTMNWKRCLTVLLSLTTTLPVFALDKPGFYMAAGMALDATTAEDFGLVAQDSSLSALLTDAGKTGYGGTLAIGYSYPLSPKYLVMVEAGKDTGANTSFSTGAVLIANNGYFSEIDREWQFRRDWFFAIKPALRLSDATLAYLSLSHHKGSVTGRSDLYIDCLSSCDTVTSFSGNGRVSGTGFGLGLQTTIEKNWFVRAEVERIRFNQFADSTGDPANLTAFSTENLRPISTVGRFMVGYQF